MIGTLLVEDQHTAGLLELFRERIVAPRRQGLPAILSQAQERDELHEGADLEAAANLLVGSFYARCLTGEGIPQDWPERVVTTRMRGIRE